MKYLESKYKNNVNVESVVPVSNLEDIENFVQKKYEGYTLKKSKLIICEKWGRYRLAWRIRISYQGKEEPYSIIIDDISKEILFTDYEGLVT